MALNQQLRSRAIKGFEARLKALTGQEDLGYPLHNGYWLRDIITILAILRDDPKKKTELVKNLPK